jgi:hypothetical protein
MLRLPIQKAENVAEALGQETPVTVHCMGCGRSKQMDPWHIAKDLGALPFGMLVGKFMCRRCEVRLSVVLPWYAPTPERWAKTYQPPSQNMNAARGSTNPWDYTYQIDRWRDPKQARVLETLAMMNNLDAAHAAFDAIMRRKPRDPITLRARTMVLRDSVRPDVKPVK